MASTTDVLIPLRNGPAVPESVVVWLLNAEDRGLRFKVLPSGRLNVGPREAIDPTDDTFIREHRDVLKACVTYCEEAATWPC